MSKSKKDKKQKKKEKQQAEVQQSNEKFDILWLLEHEKLDSKPNMAKFLNDYVARIEASNMIGKIKMYPTYGYEIFKIYVYFFDDHSLICNLHGLKGKEYFLCDGLEEVEVKPKQLPFIEQFFTWLEEFKFVY